MKIAVIAITKNGKVIAKKIRDKIGCDIFMPIKFKDDDNIIYYEESTTSIIAKLFSSYDALICIFSLGAVVRLISRHLKDKKSDPAVIVIDDKANFVISTLSGHLGGANALTRALADILDAMPVITTAADVNETIAVDLLGREFNWEIEDDKNVTMVSAYTVNEELVGVYQDAGEKDWLKNLPKNVKVFDSLDTLKESDCKGYLIITDQIIGNKLVEKAVLYRPKTLIVGVGLHYNTSREEISKGIKDTFDRYALSLKSIKALATLDRGSIKGLEEYAKENNLSIIYYKKEELGNVQVPNPSEIVNRYENTSSVAEASALLASNAELIVEKQKYPPNLTIAVARVNYE